MKLARILLDTLQRATWPLLAISTLILAFAVASPIVFFAALNEWEIERNSWHIQKTKYEAQLRSDQPAKCKQIELTCSAEHPEPVKPAGSSGINWKSFAKWSAEMDACKEVARERAEVSCGKYDPGDFPSAPTPKFLASRIIAGAAIIWVSVLLFLFTARVVARETHQGWQRLTLVICVLSTSIISFYVASMDIQIIIPAMYGALIAGLLVPILSKRLYLWVRGGLAMSRIQLQV